MSQLTATFERKEKTAQLMWLAFILSFFLIQAVIWTVAISVTATDQSHAVVAGYDEKALLWDEEKARIVASEKLGWTSEIVVDPASDIRGFRTVTIKLNDANESPVTGATVSLTAFHRARAAQPQQVTLSEFEPGKYAGQVQVRKTGLWQFSGTASAGDDTFLIDERQQIKAGN